MIKIIAHRGCTFNHPENTLSAFQSALSEGADAIELDVHFTKDDELVIHHDYYLGNPDNGMGRILDKDLSYISRLNIKSSEHIPTLEEVFTSIGNKLFYEIELKGFTEKFIHKVISLVDQYNLNDKIEFTSPHPYILTKLKDINPNLKIGMFVPSLPNWMDRHLGQTIAMNNAILGQIDVLHCNIEFLDKQFIEDSHKRNILIHAADCDTENDLNRALEIGVDQFSTNNLKLALSKVIKR